MDLVEYIKYDGRLLAIVVRSGFDEHGTTPFTDEGMPLQLAVMNKAKGEGSEAHIHPPSDTADQVGRFRHEMLHIVSGRVEVGVYTFEGRLARRVLLETGDTIPLTEGHSTRFLENTKVIEIKEGTYPGKEYDKIWLENSRP